MDIVIQRNANLPFDVTKKYQTSKPNQQRMAVDVRQGENPQASKNHSLGKYVFDEIPPGPAGQAKIEVNFKIDQNSLLKVTMKRLDNGVVKDIEIQP